MCSTSVFYPSGSSNLRNNIRGRWCECDL